MTFDAAVTCCYLYVITRYGYPPPAEDTERYLEEMHALGFRSVELEGIREVHLQAVYERRAAIRAKLDALGLSVPYFCAVLPGLSSADPAERARNLKLFEKGCAVAALLGSKGILDNAPLPPYRFPDDIPVVRHYDDAVIRAARLPHDLDWPRYWQNLAATYRDACDVAAGHGLTYQMHPAQGVLSATTDAFLYFHDAVGRDNLRFNLDTANQFAMRENLVLALHRLAGYVDYIHVSDNRGHRMEHLPLDAGAIDWDAFFEALDQTGFDGHLGVDIGGAESGVDRLDAAYVEAGRRLDARVAQRRSAPSAARSSSP